MTDLRGEWLMSEVTSSEDDDEGTVDGEDDEEERSETSG